MKMRIGLYYISDYFAQEAKRYHSIKMWYKESQKGMNILDVEKLNGGYTLKVIATCPFFDEIEYREGDEIPEYSFVSGKDKEPIVVRYGKDK